MTLAGPVRRIAPIAGPAAATLAAMIATPLAGLGSAARRRLSHVVISGLATTTAGLGARRWGSARTGIAAAVVGVGTAAVERIGTGTGIPFGRYRYSGDLRPEIAGVPAIVPAAWFAMALPAREAAHAALGSRSTPARRVAVGAVALTAWDLFLDPQMVAEGYWRWHRRGAYRGIPISNFAGWLAVSAVVMATLELALPPTADADPGLVAEYSTMAVMETLGFAAFFRDRVVAAVGGAAMLPVAATAIRTLVVARRHDARGSR